MTNGFTTPVRREQTAWNIAQIHSGYVGSLVVQAWKAYEQGQLDDWFWKLNVLREVTGHDLKEKEIESLDNLEQEIFDLRKQGQKKRAEFKEKVLEYARQMMKLIKIQGYLPSKEDRTRLSF